MTKDQLAFPYPMPWQDCVWVQGRACVAFPVAPQKSNLSNEVESWTTKQVLVLEVLGSWAEMHTQHSPEHTEISFSYSTLPPFFADGF
jgi:hypothetical protein